MAGTCRGMSSIVYFEYETPNETSRYHLKCCNKMGGPAFTKLSEVKRGDRLRYEH